MKLRHSDKKFKEKNKNKLKKGMEEDSMKRSAREGKSIILWKKKNTKKNNWSINNKLL